jgi:formylglycine-generating enzyme
MSVLGRLLWVVMCMIGLVACGFPRPSDVGGNDAGAPDDETSIDGSSTSIASSCIGLATTCGISGNESCCISPEVVGGTYYRSYDLAGDSNSGNASYPATISNFRLDKYEVTVGRFRAFMQAGMGTQSHPPVARAGAHANISGTGWETSWNANLAVDQPALVVAIKCNSTFQMWTDTPADNEDRPMNCITWYEAMAFCAWDGGYLPTEAEWNYAATGGDQHRAYPWSSPAGSRMLDSSYASYYDGTNCVGDGTSGCAATDLVVVGTKPQGTGRWGQMDLAGNVSEWTLDWYASYETTCTNCANLTLATYRVFRGGGYGSFAEFLRAGFRDETYPTLRNPNIGVRCARSAP